MNHLLREDLVRWRDEGRAEDRERITSHLAECEACTAAYAEVIRTAPLAAAPARLDPAAFVARGYAVRRAARPAAVFLPRSLWAGALSAAALLAVIVFVAMPPGDDRGRGGTVTRGGVTIAAPADPAAISWTSGVAAARYEVLLVDAQQGIVFQSDTAETALSLPADVRARLAPGDYTWRVTAIDPEGRAIVTATRTVALGAAR